MRSIAIGILVSLLVVSAALADEIIREDQVVRSGPSPRYRVVGRLPRNTQVEVTGEASFNYLPIRYEGGRGRGWVVVSSVLTSDEDLTTTKPGSTRSATEPALRNAESAQAPGSADEAPTAPKLATRPRFAPEAKTPGSSLNEKSTRPPPALGGKTLGSASSRTGSGHRALAPAAERTPEIRQLRTRKPRPRDSARTPRPRDSARKPRPRDSARTPRPRDSARKPRPRDSAREPRDQERAEGRAGDDADKTESLGASGSVRMVNERLTVIAKAIVRAGPGRQYRTTGVLFPNARVQVSSALNGWCVITHDSGLTGFVEGTSLSASQSVGRVERAATTGVALDESPLNGGLAPKLPGRRGGADPAGAGSEPRSSAGFIQLKSSGPGYYSYSPSSGQWGKPRLIYAIMRVGRRLKAGGLPRLGVGDISLKSGSVFTPHKSHRRGLDVDCRLMYADRSERAGTVNDRNYSAAWTAIAIRLFREEIEVRHVFLNDLSMVQAGLTKKVQGHHNHFHVGAR